MIQLYEHQIKGKEYLLTNKKSCLFYEIGTGKTYTALAALCELPPGRVLIVAPKRVLQNVWLSDKHYDLSKHDVTYNNYEKIARDPDFTKKRYDYIILDEVHKLKGKTTKTSRKFRTVTAHAEYVWGLTGTPQANNYADVYNIYRNMNILEFNMNYDEFVSRYYFTKSLMSQSGFSFAILIAPRKENLAELVERIGRHSTVKRLKDCIDLPDKRVDVVYVDKTITPQYKEIKMNILKYGETERTMIGLETLNKLHQAANNFFYDDTHKAIELSEVNHKFEELKDVLEDMLEETERVIIVYYYKYDLELLQKLPYTWTLNPTEFPTKQILFLQYQQGEGLNLQYCNHMIFYTYDYSFLNYEQMAGRIYRTGQVNNVVYTIFISKSTIEEKIWDAIVHKKSRDEYLKEALSCE